MFSKATVHYGVTQLCYNFRCSQDQSVGILAWLYDLYHIIIPGPTHIRNNSYIAKPGIDGLLPDLMIVHPVINDKIECLTEHWTRYKYDHDMVIGCGNLTHQLASHNPHKKMNMYDVWHYFEKNGQDVYSKDINHHNSLDWEIVTELTYFLTQRKHKPKVFRHGGYSSTKHSKLYNITEEWVTFNASDCYYPGLLTRHVDEPAEWRYLPEEWT